MGSEAELFGACFELPPDEQARYLDRACEGDAALRARVERLLEAHRRAEAGAFPALGDLPAEAMPDVIGPYRLLGVLGEGGMGVVYEAEQQEPVRRRVALKVVRAGMDTPQVVARFTAERQALASMEHPCVATVFDAGQTVAGRPYFVMERVRGEPLLEFCARRRLPIRGRVALLVKVCQAVQHAHHKGVVHRDLKPSNVLVSDAEGGPVPKVIDFGIAKAIGRDEREAAGMTRAGQSPGTPAYMSPEQAGAQGLEGVAPDVDTRSDVYALGVLLYELLTGALPVDPESLGQAEFLARLGRGELDFPRPSARAKDARIPDDLDWIAMKALEADRARRYQTALSLAEDLERWLRDEPVRARPPQWSYRLKKYVRRHRVGVAAAAVSVLALAGGAAAATVGLVRATRAEAAATREAEKAREVAHFLTELFAASDPNLRGSQTTLRELLDRGAARVDEKLADQPELQASLFETFAHVYGALGVHREAVALAERSLGLDAAGGRETAQTARAALTLGRSRQDLGQLDEARKAYQRAVDLRARLLGPEAIEVAQALNHLGGLEGQLGRYEEAMAAHRRALAIQERVRGPEDAAVVNSLRGIAILHSKKKEFAAALPLQQRALAILEKTYGGEHPLVGNGLVDLAWDLKDLGRVPEARASAERGLAIQSRTLGRDHPKVAFTHQLLGELLEAEQRPDAALAAYREALRIREAALGKDSPRVADALTAIGLLRLRMGDPGAAKGDLARALDIFERAYGKDHSRTVRCREGLEQASR